MRMSQGGENTLLWIPVLEHEVRPAVKIFGFFGKIHVALDLLEAMGNDVHFLLEVLLERKKQDTHTRNP